MARAKRPSDELYNARRRARRAAERLERAGHTEAASTLRAAAQAGTSTTAGELDRMRSVALASSAAKSAATRAVTTAKAQHTPRAKRPSDEVYNARRRVRREAARLEKMAQGQQGDAREITLERVRAMRELAKAGRQLTADERRQTVSQLDALRNAARTERRNQVFMSEINRAGMKDVPSAIPRDQAKAFWVAVTPIYTGAGMGSKLARNQRYEIIRDYFWRSDSPDARGFREWLAERLAGEGRDLDSARGDLGYIFEYVTEVMNNPEDWEQPGVDWPSSPPRVFAVR